ncbi:Uncharacterised protein [Mycobacteroides abscessus subsp. abscessus]|nr:Uncharacterised protein [Mycobacteroides abscessus subsp. abscessus]
MQSPTDATCPGALGGPVGAGGGTGICGGAGGGICAVGGGALGGW